MRPSIACVITTNNRPEFLREALESVLRQSRQPDAIIVSDSFPDTRTPEVLQMFEGRLADILYFQWKTPASASANARKALSLAETDYIASLHDDDLWEATHLQDFENAITGKPDAWLYFTKALTFGTSNDCVIAPWFLRGVTEITHEAAGSDVCRWLSGYSLACSSVIFQRRALEKIRCMWNSKTGALDFILMVQMAAMGGFIYNPSPGSRYRIHPINETNSVLTGRGGAASIRYGCRALTTIALRRSLLTTGELERFLLKFSDIDGVAGILLALTSFDCDARLRQVALSVAKQRREELRVCRSRHTRIAARLGPWYFGCADLLDRVVGRWWPGEQI